MEHTFTISEKMNHMTTINTNSDDDPKITKYERVIQYVSNSIGPLSHLYIEIQYEDLSDLVTYYVDTLDVLININGYAASIGYNALACNIISKTGNTILYQIPDVTTVGTWSTYYINYTSFYIEHYAVLYPVHGYHTLRFKPNYMKVYKK